MRLLKLLVVALAIIVAVTGTVLYITSAGKFEAPKITCSVEGAIEVSSDVTDNDLLAFVSAKDKQDGDLTDEIIVVRKKFFIDKKTSLVTFSVCDSDNNVTALQKEIIYTDYTPPTLDLKNDFIFPSGRTYGDLAGYVTATDKFDGDLSKYVKLISTEFTTSEGKYPINLKVSNSMGDTEDITIDAMVLDEFNFNVRINLKNYISYASVGSEPDYMSYVVSVTGSQAAGREIKDITVNADEVDMSTPGIYNVYYTIKEKGNRVALARLILIVREEY